MRVVGHSFVLVLALLSVTATAATPAEAQDKARPAGKSAGKHVAQKPTASPAKPKIGAPQRGGGGKKPAKKPTKPIESKKSEKKPGSEPKPADPVLRASVAGKPIEEAAAESPELKGLREVDDLLFWDIEVKAPLNASGAAPEVVASGLPPTTTSSAADSSLSREGDHRWMSQLRAPDLPFRWDVRLIRYLDYFKNNPKGQSFVASLLRRSGRYDEKLRAALKKKGLPEDLVYLALAESGMNARVVSHAGAAGLWQFMPKTADAYGLRIDKWVDERLDPYRSTEAAIRYLSDLHTRFGRWELAMASYNMGHGGLLTAIRKYNTNDFWELSQLEAGVPYETALYVPKILAIAFVARNKEVFGCGELQLDPAEKFEIASTIAPPEAAAQKTAAAPESAKTASESPALPPQALEKVVLRWGESLESLAAQANTTESKLRAINGLKDPVPPRPGTQLMVPKTSSKRPPAEPAVVVVPARTTAHAGTTRVFYEAVWGDKLDDVANVLGVKADELCQWNNLDRTANLHGKMVLQAFVRSDKSLSNVRLVEAKDATILTVGSSEFFDHFEAKNGRVRQVVTAQQGDSISSLAKKHGVTLGMMERINKRSRDAAVKVGETIVVYSRKAAPPKAPKATAGGDLYADDQSSAPDIEVGNGTN